MVDALDPATKELLGVAAAVAGHCEPCFAYHYKEAVALGISVEVIQAAIELARAIRGSGDRHIDEFVTRRMAQAVLGSTRAAQ